MSRTPCEAQATAKNNPEHIHSCLGEHTIEDHHFCPGCRKWWSISNQ